MESPCQLLSSNLYGLVFFIHLSISGHSCSRIFAFLPVWGTWIGFQGLCRSASPPIVHGSSLFSASSTTTIVCCLFNNSRLTGVRWHLIFCICISLMISDAEPLSHVSLPHSYVFFWETVYSGPLSRWVGLFVILKWHCMRFLHFSKLNPYQIHSLQIASPVW